MKYIFYPIHLIVGSLIRLIDWLTSPRKMQRPPEKQADVDEQTRHLTLYHYPACPFCVRVRRNMRRLNLDIKQVDPRKNDLAMRELTEEGGKIQVPCLRISESDGSHRLMYESADINAYLDKRFENT